MIASKSVLSVVNPLIASSKFVFACAISSTVASAFAITSLAACKAFAYTSQLASE